MRNFLMDNEAWMVERFGAERVEKMRTSIDALNDLASTSKTVHPGGHGDFQKLRDVLTSWGPFLSRLNAVSAGRSSEQFFVGERIARTVGNILKGKTDEALTTILEDAFYDPQVAQTIMLAQKGASEQLIALRLKKYLLPKTAVLADHNKE